MSERGAQDDFNRSRLCPRRGAASESGRLFREMVPWGAIEAMVYEELTFIDQAQCCDAVLCSFCGNRVAVDPFSGTDLAGLVQITQLSPRTDIVTTSSSSCGRSRRL